MPGGYMNPERLKRRATFLAPLRRLCAGGKASAQGLTAADFEE
jgi:hypothetical protein